MLTEEVEKVLGPLAAGSGSATATVDQSVLAADRVRQRYAAITGNAAAEGEGKRLRPKRSDGGLTPPVSLMFAEHLHVEGFALLTSW